MKPICGIIFFLLLFLSQQSCKDEYTICTLDKNVNFIAGFYQRQGGTDISTTAPRFNVFLLNGSGGPIYDNQQNVHSFSLPLNPQADSARYLVTLSNTSPADTITIVYSTQSVNLSTECGNVFYNNISRFYSTTHTIDSVRIVSAAINTVANENARIYFQ